MSFGFGATGAQGQIRYALIVDDAMANQKLGNFKNSLTQLAPATANVNKNMGALANNFKGVSGGLTQQNTLIGQTVSQHKTLGQTLSTSMQRFSGLATGLAATASGALQLAAGFRDYSDAQIAVDRTTRRLSLANEALGKAQDKLNALQKAGVKSGKEYEQATLDVQQAQAQQEIQTQLLGEAQERMFDSQTQFVVSIVPTVLGAVGSLGAAFKEFGGSLGGIGQAIKGLSSQWMSFAGAAAGAGFALVVIQQVDAAQKKLDELGVKFQKLPGLIFASQKQMKAAAEEYDIIIEKTGRSMAQILFDAEGTKKAWIDAGGAVDEAGNIIFDTKTKVSDLGDAFTATTDDYAKWAAQMMKDNKPRAEIIKWLTDSGIKLSDQNVILEKATKLLKDTSKATGEFNVQLEKQAKKLEEVNALGAQTMLTLDDWRMKFAETLIVASGQTGLTAGKEIGEGMAKGLNAMNQVLKQSASSAALAVIEGTMQALGPRLAEFDNTVKKFWTESWRDPAFKAMDEVEKITAGSANKIIDNINRLADEAKKALEAFGRESRLKIAAEFGIESPDEKADKLLDKFIDKIEDKSKGKKLKLALKAEAEEQAFSEFAATIVTGLEGELEKDDKLADMVAKQLIKETPDTADGEKMKKFLQGAIDKSNTGEILSGSIQKDLDTGKYKLVIPTTGDITGITDSTGTVTLGGGSRFTGAMSPSQAIAKRAKTAGSVALTGIVTKIDYTGLQNEGAGVDEFGRIYDSKGNVIGQRGANINIPGGTLPQGKFPGGAYGGSNQTMSPFPNKTTLGGAVTAANPLDVGARQIVQITRNISVLARAIAQITSNFNTWARAIVTTTKDLNMIARAVAQTSSNNNSFARTVAQLTKNFNSYARTIVETTKDLNQYARATSQSTKNNNTFAKTIVETSKDFNTMARTISQNTKNLNTFARAVAQSTKNVKSLASAINSLKDKTVTVTVRARLVGPSAATSRIGSGGIISAASGFPQEFTTNGPQLIMVGDNPGGMEDITVVPRNNPGPTVERINRKYGTKGDTVINATFNVSGNEIINPVKLKKMIRLETGRNMDKYGA